MRQGIREAPALVKSRLARSSKMKLMVWEGYFITINPGPVTVIKPSMQSKQDAALMLCFNFSSPHDRAITFCDSVCFRIIIGLKSQTPQFGTMKIRETDAIFGKSYLMS
jgi:hypothetical protein